MIHLGILGWLQLVPSSSSVFPSSAWLSTPCPWKIESRCNTWGDVWCCCVDQDRLLSCISFHIHHTDDRYGLKTYASCSCGKRCSLLSRWYLDLRFHSVARCSKTYQGLHWEVVIHAWKSQCQQSLRSQVEEAPGVCGFSPCVSSDLCQNWKCFHKCHNWKHLLAAVAIVINRIYILNHSNIIF